LSNIIVLLMLFATVMFWGIGFPISKLGVDYIPPFTFAFLRFFITSIIFSIIMIKKYNLKVKTLTDNFLILSIMGISGITAYNFFYLYSLKLTLVSNSALIAAFNPIITTIIASIVLKEKINNFMWIGIILSFFGVLLIISHGSIAIVQHLSFNKGDMFMFIATSLWAAYSVSAKIAMKRLDFFTAVGLSTILGTIYLIPFVLFEPGSENIFSYPLVSWFSVFYMSIVATFFAFTMWYKGIERFGASKTSIFVNLVPVFGVIASSLMLNEKIEPITLMGGGMVIVGVVITNRMKT